MRPWFLNVEVYMAFALFCVLNVMTGVFVENASKMTSADEAMGRKLGMGMACNELCFFYDAYHEYIMENHDISWIMIYG